MPKILSSVKAILLHKGEFLILREDLPKGPIWDLPGGKIKYGESPEEALHREVKEELDLNIKIIKPLGTWSFYTQQEQNQVICQTFLCKPKGKVKIDTSKNPALDEHFSELIWQTFDEALKNNDITIENSLKKIITNLKQDYGK